MKYPKLEDIKTIRFIDCHEGNKSANGGEYAFGRDWKKLKSGEDFEEIYWTSSDLPMCPISGHFQECSQCMDYDPEEGSRFCHNPKIYKSVLEVIYNPKTNHKDWNWDENKNLLEINLTGHNYRACKVDGGCIDCYPCNHTQCYE